MEPTCRPSRPVARLRLQEMSSLVPPCTSCCPRSDCVVGDPILLQGKCSEHWFVPLLASDVLEHTQGGLAHGAVAQGTTEERPTGMGMLYTGVISSCGLIQSCLCPALSVASVCPCDQMISSLALQPGPRFCCAGFASICTMVGALKALKAHPWERGSIQDAQPWLLQLQELYMSMKEGVWWFKYHLRCRC